MQLQDGRDLRWRREQAVEGLLAQLLGGFPNFWLQRIATHHADDAVIVECKFGGTQVGEWAARSADGKTDGG